MARAQPSIDVARDADVGLLSVRVAAPLAVRIRAPEVHAGREVLQRRGLLVGRLRVELVGEDAGPVHVEVARRHLEERVLPHDRRQVQVEQVLRRLLVDRRDRVRLRGAGAPVRLELLVVGPEARELVVLRELVLRARREVPQVRVEQRREAGDVLVGAVVAHRPEPPEAIPDEGTAAVGVEVGQLLEGARGLDPVEPRLLVEVVAGQALSGGAVDRLALQVVAARLGNHVDVGAAAAADFRAHRRRVDRDLLGRSVVHVVHRAVVLRRVRGDAVVIQVVRARAVRHHAGRRRGVEAAGVLPAHRHARQHGGGAEDGARGRHGRQRLAVQAGAHLRVLHVHGRRRAADGDRFLQLRQLELGVNRDRAPYGHDDAVSDQGREARQIERELVGARVDGGEAVLSALVGGGGLAAHDRGTRERDGDAGQHAALRVGHSADQFAEHLACLGRGRREGGQQQGQRRDAPKERTFHG